MRSVILQFIKFWKAFTILVTFSQIQPFYTRGTRWLKGSIEYCFLQFNFPSSVVEINLFFNLQHLGDPGRCGAFAAWWKVSKRGNNAPLRSNPERGRGGHWTTDATFLKIASKTLLKKAFLERNSKNIPSVVSKHFSFENLLSSRESALTRKFAGNATSACIKGSTFLTHPTFQILFACMQTFLTVWKFNMDGGGEEKAD